MGTRRLTSLEQIMRPELHGLRSPTYERHSDETVRLFRRMASKAAAEMFGGRAEEREYDGYSCSFHLLALVDARGEAHAAALLHILCPFVALIEMPVDLKWIEDDLRFLPVDALERHCKEPLLAISPEVLAIELNWEDFAGNEATFGKRIAAELQREHSATVGEYVFRHRY